MRRYWLDESAFESFEVGGSVRIEGDTLHHIRDVCRQTVGDKFEVLAQGAAYLVTVTGEAKRELTAEILEVREIEQLPTPRLRLAIAVPRFNVFEAVLEKMVEMGVEQIQPLLSDNSFIRTDLSSWKNKEARFQKIIQSATQQSGRGEKMELLAPRKLSEFRTSLVDEINRSGQTAGLFAYEVGRVPIREALTKVRRGSLENLWFFIGGEGGFSRQEVLDFEAAGFEAVTLGRQVLRVETACVAISSVLKYELDLMR